MNINRPLAIDLFCGAGGLSLGMEQAGFDVVASVEYDPVHAAVHDFNFPLCVTLCADVSTLTADAIRDAARVGRERHGHLSSWDGQIDAIVGGPPCQGFSTIGKRLIDDKRNDLVFHYFRLVCELRPRYFVMENVPGMKAGGHAGILTRLIAEFQDAGYRTVAPIRVLNAADYGVPQDRKRLIVIGARDDQPDAHYPDPTVHHAAKRPGAARQMRTACLPEGPTVWDAIGDVPDLDAFDVLLSTDEVSLTHRHVAAAAKAASPYAAIRRGTQREPGDLSHPRRWSRATLTSSARTKHTDLSIARFAGTAPGDTEPVSRFYRLHPEGLSNTLRAGTGSERGAYTSPRPIHPRLPRVISVREAARLHSFPDWFRLHATKWHGFRQIGNAVCPLLGRAIAREIVRALDVSPARPAVRVELSDPGLLRMTMVRAAEHYGAAADSIPAQRVRQGQTAAPDARAA